MSCLALSLQPTNGPDILLQTREWFPPARALAALSAFRHTRLAYTSGSSKNQPSDDVVGDPALVGDDPLAASSGQVIVGVESRYRVVYRLVNAIYVLGVTTADDDNNNVFECISIVNQAVSVVVSACRGVDVTPEKLGKKYAEVYMALDIVLKGASNIRLAAMLGCMHGDSIAKMVHSGIDSENKMRGADSWASLEGHSIEQDAGVEAFKLSRFEMPPETLTAGDNVAASIAPQAVQGLGAGEQDEGLLVKAAAAANDSVSQEPKDPFAASDVVNNPESLVGDFRKNKDATSDPMNALNGIDVTSLPPAEAAQPTHISVDGFEGDYGGIEFSKEEASLDVTFEGFSAAFGGGLDASEFVGPTKAAKKEGLGGLELLQTGPDAPPAKDAAPPGQGATPLENLLVQKTEMKGPKMYITEEINAEFRESLLARVGVKGVVYLRTLPPKTAGDKETEFSFRIDGTTSVKRVVIQSSKVSSLGNGMFHVRTPAAEEPIPVLKYSLLPRLTPLPLRVRLVQRHSGTLLSVMIQYVSNPELTEPLTDVTFVLKLPVDPTLLKVSPKAILNRSERELKWHVKEIPLKDSPGKLRVRMPVDVNEEDLEEVIEVVCLVKFSQKRVKSLSGVSIWPASEGKTDFYVVDHKVESGMYMCN